MDRRRGKRAERRAVWWYRLRGYRILAQNAWVAGYELDIIVRRGRRLIFCEVKEKLGLRFGDPIEMVDAGLDVSFDVIAVRSGRLERLAQAF